MKKTKIHWCAVFVLAAFLLFTVSSCIEPGAGSSGVFIDITSDSIGLTSDQDGYFTGSGSIEISKGKAVSFEYDVERTIDDGGVTYYGESGRAEYSSESMEGGPLLNIDTENMYVETVSGGSSVAPPGISPVQGNLQKEASYYWTNGSIDAITGADWQGGVKQSDWRAEYSYDVSNRIEKRIEGEWNGSSITRYYDVKKYFSFDVQGYPQDEDHYVDAINNLTSDPVDAQEVTEITVNKDASGLHDGFFGYYFLINSPTTEYYVWYNVDGTKLNPNGSVPSLGTKTGIMVSPVTSPFLDDSSAVASKTSVALNAIADFFATPFANVLIVQNNNIGAADDAQGGTAGFGIVVNTQGVGPVETPIYVYTYGSLTTPDAITINGEYKISYTYDASGNVTQIDFYDTGGTVLFGTVAFDIPAGESLTFDDLNPFTSPIGKDIIDRLAVLPW